MKTFKKAAAQGDLYIRRIKALPNGVVVVAPSEGRHVIGHSETGHHHVMEAATTEMYRLPDELYECFVVVKKQTSLDHLRPFDTHESILHGIGMYHVRTQREYVPNGWRKSAD